MSSPIPPVNIDFHANGVDGVRRGLRLVGTDAGNMAQRVGGASRQIASGIEAIARTGKASGESLKQIVSQGAEMAFMFGAGGPIIGAIGILGVALVSSFTRARDEIRKTTNTAIEEAQRFGEAGDLVAASRAQGRLYSGSAFALRLEGESDTKFLARSKGLAGVKARVKELTDALAAQDARLEKMTAQERNAALWGTNLGKTMAAQRAELQELAPLQKELQGTYDRLTPVVKELTATEAKRAEQASKRIRENAGTEATVAAAKKEAAEAKREREELEKLVRQHGFGQPGTVLPLQQTPFGSATNMRPIGVTRSVSLTPLGPQTGEGLGSAFHDAFKTGIQGAVEFNNALEHTNELIGTQLGEAAAELPNILSDAFGNAIALGRGFGSAIADGVRSMAIGQGKLYAAKALGAFADGLFWGDPKAFAAAAKYGAASAAFFAVASVGGGGGSGGGGYGGGYSSGKPQIIDRGIIDPTRAAVTTASQATPQKPIFLQPIIIGDNPRVARQIQEMLDSNKGRG